MSKKYLFPYELVEVNWRLWSFIAIMGLGFSALLVFPVPKFDGYIDPLYSPTVLVIPLLGFFRLTCYAFRKNYHRHIFHHPLACGNADRRESSARPYTGERNAIFQVSNFHRYFLYAALILLPIVYYDFYQSLTFAGGFTLRVGSLVLLADALILTTWTVSCHSFRHVTGGNIDCYSCVYGGGSRSRFFGIQSRLNEHHETLAWTSLIAVILADLYLRALQAGLPVDYKLL